METQEQGAPQGEAPLNVAVERELDAALAASGEAPAAAADASAGELVVDAAGEPWGPFLKVAIAPVVFGVVLPQWQFSDEEQAELVGALGQCCDQLFPGGPAGKYACWVRLIVGGAGMVGVRMVNNGGKPLPFGPKRIAQQKADGASA